MPFFTIETSLRLPVYRQRTYEADTVDEACRIAVEDVDWSGEKPDHESAGDTYVSGVWLGADTAYHGNAQTLPTQFGETTHRKADHFEVLLGVLKVLSDLEQVEPNQRPFWHRRARAAIANAEAILAGSHDPDAGASGEISSHSSREAP